MGLLSYLDTHIVVWLYSGEADLFSQKAKEQIENSDLYVSPTVLLELQYLFETKKILKHPHEILDDLVSRIGIRVCDLPFPQVVETALLENWTRDPFDRLIVAQALIRHAPLISKDKKIAKNYVNTVW